MLSFFKNYIFSRLFYRLPYRTQFRRTKLSKFWGQWRKFCPTKNLVRRKFCPRKYFVRRIFVQHSKQYDICFDGTFSLVTGNPRNYRVVLWILHLFKHLPTRTSATRHRQVIGRGWGWHPNNFAQEPVTNTEISTKIVHVWVKFAETGVRTVFWPISKSRQWCC